MQNKLISIGEAARLLGVSIDTLRRWDAAGHLPSIRVGLRGHRFYRYSEITHYLQSLEVTAREWVESENPIESSPDVYCRTMNIALKKFGTTLVSRPAGKEAWLAFQPVLKEVTENEQIIVDFKDVVVLTPSWADEFLTPLKKNMATMSSLLIPAILRSKRLWKY